MHVGLQVKYPLSWSDFNQEMENFPVLNLIEIHSAVFKLLHAK